MSKLLYESETYAIRGAVFEVYKQMGSGFLEAVYQECLEMELRDQGIPFESQKNLGLAYKGRTLTQTYEPDFICYGTVIIELKAAKELADEHRAQIINYLKASGMKVGLLVNFGHYPKIEIERYAL